MLKRLFLLVLICLVVVAGVRPGVAIADHGYSAAMEGMESQDHHPTAPCADERDSLNHLARSSGCCLAMMAGCFAPAIGSEITHVARRGAGVRWTPWPIPAENLVPVAVAPDLRPPRATL